MLQPITVINGRSAVCELRFKSDVTLVSVVRRFVSAFYERVLGGDAPERIALATHELLENAVMYSADNETGLRIEVDHDKPSPEICVRAWNRTTPEHRAVLAGRFERFTRATDPFDVYQELMLVAATRTDGSGLGLARVRAEADMSLAFELQDDQVCIIARTTTEAQAVR
jgi:anti-sigma regulatory factor (Ser/Thr protein kinase)